MPLDAICLRALLQELTPQITGSRIEKIQQPARDQVILLLRGSRRLLLCASPSAPRLQLTEILRDNPTQPPMFCMLLRKHLSGGRITAVEQPELERVVRLSVEAADEFGEQSRYQLILEAMNRRANLILTDGEGRIMDCLRRVDSETSPERPVLPGLYYRLPPRAEKRDPLTVTEEEFSALCAGKAPEKLWDAWLLETFTALPPLVAREIVYRACGSVDAAGPESGALWESFALWQRQVNEGAAVPTLLLRDGAMMDFTYGPVRQYGGCAVCETRESFCALLDEFYRRREQAERVKQRGQELLKTASNALHRVSRKIALQEKEYEKTKERDTLRLHGELITANFYRMKRGDRVLRAENYYQEGCPAVEIPLDVRLSPQENAARYFKQYTKARTAEKILSEQLELGRAEKEYLESVLQELQQAETEQDFNDIRAELSAGGYLRRQGKKSGFERPSRPRQFRSTAGLRILVGRNNQQNDALTKKADGRDLWFHTQKIHGSHVILCTEGGAADEKSIEEAAVLAAFYSQGREGGRVAVDYTPVRFVKKPAGARPGKVIYTTYQTIQVRPEEETVRKLEIG